MSAPRPPLFDANALGRRRDRAMRLGFRGGADFLWRIAATGLAERVADCARPFPSALIFGTGAGAVAEALPSELGAVRCLQIDSSPEMAAAAAQSRPTAETIVSDSEIIPAAPGGFDIALSVMGLHWANDPVGHLVQLRRALRPDGLMLAALLGGETLAGLRAAFAMAETEVLGGITPRVAPMGELRDLGGLIGRAGFSMPVADREVVRVSYADPLALMRELRAMGETSILAGRARGGLRRELLARVIAHYRDGLGTDDGRVDAVFELIFLTGWAPGPNQPSPLRPGSATVRLADALGTLEMPADDTPGHGKNDG